MNELANFQNALFGSLNQANQIWDKAIRTQAEADLAKMNAQAMQDDTQFFTKLQSNPNYDQWETEIAQHYEKRKALFSKDSPDNPYYCRNNLTAELATKQLENSMAQMQAKAFPTAYQNMQTNSFIKFENSKQQVAQNLTDYRQSVDQQNAITEQEFEAGLIDQVKYETALQTTATNAAIKSLGSYADTLIDTAIKNGAGWNKVEELIRTKIDEENYSYVSRISGANEVDKQNLGDTVIKSKQQKFTAMQRDYQDKNERTVEDEMVKVNDMFLSIINNQNVYSMQQLQSNIDKTAAMITAMKESDMGTGVRKQKLKELESLRSSLSSYIKSTSGSGSSKDQWTLSDFYAKQGVGNLVEKFKNGEVSAQVAADSIKQIMLEPFDYPEKFKDFNNKSANVLAAEKENTSISATLKIFNDNYLKNVLNQPGNESIKEEWNNILKDVEKDKEHKIYDEQAAEYLSDFMRASLSYSNKDADKTAITKNMKQALSNVTLNKMNKIWDPNKNIAEQAQTLKENDTVYLPVGKENTEENYVYAPGSEEQIKEYKRNAAKEVAVALGMNDITGLKTVNRLDENGDPTNEFIVENKDGSQYVINYETNKKGKATGDYTVDKINKDKDGKETYKTVATSKELKEKRKQFDDMASEAQKKARENTKAVHNAVEAEQDKAEANYNNRLVTQKQAPKFIDQKDWERAGTVAAKKQTLVTNVVNEMDKAAKSISKAKYEIDRNAMRQQFENKYGISYTEWLKKSVDNKQSFILNN